MRLRVGPWGAARPAEKHGAARPAEQDGAARPAEKDDAARPVVADASETEAPEPAAPPPDDTPSQYPCPNCGAILGYQPGAHVLTCAFCGTVTEIAQGDAQAQAEAVREQDFAAALRDGAAHAAMEVTQTVRCDACGAQVDFDPNQHAAVCPFCATPLVADPAPDRHIRPQALLPFAIPEREAQARIRRWLSGLWFAPNGLKKFARTNASLGGVYTPYWTVDARTETAYSGQRGDTYFVTVRGADGKPSQVARVRWRPVSGRVRRAFDDVLVLGATSLPKADTDALAPWDLQALQPYARDYLAGFRAETYTVPLQDGYTQARRLMDDQIRRDVRAAIGGDQQRIARLDTRVSDVTFKHVLLPVWIGAYKYGGKSWRVVINGRTGAVRGARPYSWLKIAGAALAGIALAALALWLLQQGNMR